MPLLEDVVFDSVEEPELFNTISFGRLLPDLLEPFYEHRLMLVELLDFELGLPDLAVQGFYFVEGLLATFDLGVEGAVRDIAAVYDVGEVDLPELVDCLPGPLPGHDQLEVRHLLRLSLIHI